MSASAPIWMPGPERIEAARLTEFIRLVNESCGASVQDFPAVYEWSIRQPAQFWDGIWNYGGVVASRRADTVVTDLARMPGAQWFPGARLNFAENLLRYRDDGTALVAWNENGFREAITYDELNHRAARVAARLREWGIRPGDRVAGYLPNLPETVIAMLAATSLGAIWTSCSPDFGLHGVLDRFGQVQPRVLFAAASYQYGGKRHSYLHRVRDVEASIESIERTVLVPYLDAAEPVGNEVAWENCIAAGAPGHDLEQPRFEHLAFDHPAYILYSSGTTGKPKCIVHGGGGTLVQHLKELMLHTDLRRSDVIVYFTTCGWMMWNWLVSGLAVGATLVLYDGSPLEPHAAALWDLAERCQVTVFGASAKYLSSSQSMKSSFPP